MEKDLPGPLLLINDAVVDAIKNIDKIKEQYKFYPMELIF